MFLLSSFCLWETTSISPWATQQFRALALGGEPSEELALSTSRWWPATTYWAPLPCCLLWICLPHCVGAALLPRGLDGELSQPFVMVLMMVQGHLEELKSKNRLYCERLLSFTLSFPAHQNMNLLASLDFLPFIKKTSCNLRDTLIQLKSIWMGYLNCNCYK